MNATNKKSVIITSKWKKIITSKWKRNFTNKQKKIINEHYIVVIININSMKNNKNKPSYNEAAKMFDIVDSYLCEVHNKGWNGMKL